MSLFPPGVRPDRALITEATNVLGVPCGAEEDISGNGESGDRLGMGIREISKRFKVDPKT